MCVTLLTSTRMHLRCVSLRGRKKARARHAAKLAGAQECLMLYNLAQFCDLERNNPHVTPLQRK